MYKPVSGAHSTTPLDELLIRVARGDRDAFAALYNALSPQLHGAAHAIIRNRALAEEIIQDVFLEVWQKADRFDATRGTAAGWITTMARRRAIDRVRSTQADTDRDLRHGRREHAVAYDVVSEAVEITHEAARIQRFMGGLTAFQREVIDLAHLQGLSHAEIGAHLGIPLGTVKTRLRDAVTNLRTRAGLGSVK